MKTIKLLLNGEEQTTLLLREVKLDAAGETDGSHESSTAAALRAIGTLAFHAEDVGGTAEVAVDGKRHLVRADYDERRTMVDDVALGEFVIDLQWTKHGEES